MGNSHSSASKSGAPAPAPASVSASTATSPSVAQSPSSSHHDSPRRHRSKESRNIISPHASHRSVAPPEASLAQAIGSTVVSRPKSLPPTALSSLSGSPHSNVSTPAKHAEARPVRDEPSKPVDVPTEPSSIRSYHSHHTGHAAQGATRSEYPEPHLVANSSITDMYITRPPRLPLPIEEEVHTPGSPILAPDDDLPDVEFAESSDGLTRKSSAVSATTVDEDDAEELRVDKTRPVVPTKLEWKRGGDKIYVTGTIFQWNRKQRLHPVEGKPGYFVATIYILPGTHHVRFLVDGIMQTSPDLPTTVDFGNNLVNYIEVNPDDVPQNKQSHVAPKSAGAGPEIGAGLASRSASQTKDQPKQPKGRTVLPAEKYRSPIPQYLLDFDQAEDSPVYRNAVSAIEKLPTPPSLPGFLGKPILNAATLMKDDNSVLNMPNHTVLNHLATSSIKNNILAVSATTRYRNKYVTTIIYKPTSTDEG